MSEMSLSFRAQSLDNRSPDPMEYDGKTLEDQEQRQQLVQDIDRVSINGSPVHPDPDGRISAFLHRDKFILEIPSDRRDSAGRIAPIICYGPVPDEAQPDAIVKAIQGFAGRIGRGVSDEDASSAQRVLEELVKKNTGAWQKLKNVLLQMLIQIWEKMQKIGRKIKESIATLFAKPTKKRKP